MDLAKHAESACLISPLFDAHSAPLKKDSVGTNNNRGECLLSRSFSCQPVFSLVVHYHHGPKGRRVVVKGRTVEISSLKYSRTGNPYHPGSFDELCSCIHSFKSGIAPQCVEASIFLVRASNPRTAPIVSTARIDHS